MRNHTVMLLLGLCVVAGCLAQGVLGVYYVMVETESYDANEDGEQDGIIVFILFKDRELEPVVFYEAEGTAHIWVYQEGMVVGEEEVWFDSSEMVGKSEGGIPVRTSGKGLGTVTVKVSIERRGEFTAEKRDVIVG
ncbi:MAG: hypothetical protein HXS51_00405 [Theionarchaea archaeon]|nr:hypothetical protein [Theionarchaea archaeon]